MKREHWIYASIGAAVLLVAAIFFLLAPEDASRSTRAGQSVFDSEFWRGPSGSTALTEGDRFLALRERTNPSSGQNYTDEEIRRIKYLATKFPNNRLIPRAETVAEQAERATHEREIEQLSLSMTAGTATEEDAVRYYEDRRKLMLDRLQLIRFVLEEEPGLWKPKVRKEYAAMLKHGQDVLNQLQDRQQRSLEALKARRSAQK